MAVSVIVLTISTLVPSFSVIVGGDFNDVPSSPAVRYILEQQSVV